ncbi:MAG: hypothetical protein ACKO96_47230, partial [Flammeovirgaceae bacterium]
VLAFVWFIGWLMDSMVWVSSLVSMMGLIESIGTVTDLMAANTSGDIIIFRLFYDLLTDLTDVNDLSD